MAWGLTIAVLVGAGLALGLAIGVAAARLGRRPLVWMLIALPITPILALPLLLALGRPPATRICAQCAERLPAATRICPYCGLRFAPEPGLPARGQPSARADSA